MDDLKNSVVFVTGGLGHIGSHIVDELVKEDVCKIIIYDNLSEGRAKNIDHLQTTNKIELIRDDIRDYEDVADAMKGVDYVFHTASLLLLEARDRPNKAIDVNIKGTYNIIRAAIEKKIKKIIFSSTGSVYGEPLQLPMTEDHPYNSETIYGTTKIACEHFLIDFHRSHGLRYVGLRYFNVYGPRQHYKGAYAQIIPRWFDYIEENKEITIFGDGSQTMDLTYVTDVARANILALKSDLEEGFVNVGTGKSTSVNQLFQMIKEITGYQGIHKYINQDVNLVRNRQCSTLKAEQYIGYKNAIDIYSGLKLYYEWRLKNNKRIEEMP